MPRDFVFLHGGEQGGWVWDELILAMRAQAPSGLGQILALDVPGCGRKRARVTEALTFAQIVEELTSDIRASGAADAVLVGHSQAGTLLPRLLEALPGVFSRAVYVSCCAPAPGQTVNEMMGQGLHGSNPDEVGWPGDPSTSGLGTLFEAMFCNDMTPGAAKSFLARLAGDHWPAACGAENDWRYGRLPDTPATYVVCLDDGILPTAWQKRFAERFAAKTVVHIQAGHQAMNSRPHGLAEILLAEAGRNAPSAT